MITGLPVCALAGLLGPLRLDTTSRERLMSTYLPWAYQAGRATTTRDATPLMNVMYEEEFTTPLATLRTRLNIITAPQ